MRMPGFCLTKLKKLGSVLNRFCYLSRYEAWTFGR
jgi:hypothetical protein